MRKTKSILLTILTILMCFPLISVKALNITTLSASETESGKITISGTTEAGVYAVAIEIYNEDESELVKLRTVSVDDSKKAKPWNDACLVAHNTESDHVDEVLIKMDELEQELDSFLKRFE